MTKVAMRCFGDKVKTYHCKVVLLDEQELIQEVQDTSTGQDLLDVVLQHLNLLETAYFGLRYLDLDNQTHWLDPTKRIAKQLKGVPPFTLYFSVKFYAADPTKLVEEITRYQLFLQVKQDILQGRLPVTTELAAELGAYAVQSELGDYDPRRHSPGYVSEFRFMAGQTVALESKIAELHKKLVGQVPAKAEINYLEKVKWLEMYGVDLHPVLGEDNIEYFLGLTPSGVIVLRNKTKVANYFWPRITKVHFRGRFFMIRVRDKNNCENTYGFETPSRSACKHLWQCCVEHHAFFRLTQSTGNSPQAVFSLGSKFRYSGRTEKEVMKEARESSRQPPEVARTPSRRYQRRIVEGGGGGGAGDAPRTDDTGNKSDPRPSSVMLSSAVCRSTSMTAANGYRPPSSPRSIRSAPYHAVPASSCPVNSRGRPQDRSAMRPTDTRSESRGSPRSVKSAAPAVMVQKSSIDRRTSSVESQSSIDSRGHRRHRRRSRCRSSDCESEASSKCSSRGRHRSHHRRKHRHRHHSDDSGDQHKHKHRRHRHKSSDSSKGLVESQDQWIKVQSGEGLVKGNMATVRGGLMKGQAVEGHSKGSLIRDNNEQQYSSSKKKHRKHRSRSGSPPEKQNRYPAELRRHIDYTLKDTNGLTEAELRDIPYTRVETIGKYAPGSEGVPKKHKSPKRSKSNCMDRKLAPPDGESPPPDYTQESNSNRHVRLNNNHNNRTEDQPSQFYRMNPSGESSTPPPPPCSVPPSNHALNSSDRHPQRQHNFHHEQPVQFLPGYLPHAQHMASVNATNYGSTKPAMINGPSIKSLVTGNEDRLYSRTEVNSGPRYHHQLINNQHVLESSSNNSSESLSPLGLQSSDQNSQDSCYLSAGYSNKPSTLERGTRGSSITKPQPSPQSSVTSGISVGSSSVSNTNECVTIKNPAHHPFTTSNSSPNRLLMIKTSDLSPTPSTSPSPLTNASSSNDHNHHNHIFFNPCNSTNRFFKPNSSEVELNSSSNPPDSTIDDEPNDNNQSSSFEHSSHNSTSETDSAPLSTNSSKHVYSNIKPIGKKHSTNIFIRYHNSHNPNTSVPTPAPRSSIVSSVVGDDSSTHIVQSHVHPYSNTCFSNNSASSKLIYFNPSTEIYRQNNHSSDSSFPSQYSTASTSSLTSNKNKNLTSLSVSSYPNIIQTKSATETVNDRLTPNETVSYNVRRDNKNVTPTYNDATNYNENAILSRASGIQSRMSDTFLINQSKRLDSDGRPSSAYSDRLSSMQSRISYGLPGSTRHSLDDSLVGARDEWRSGDRVSSSSSVACNSVANYTSTWNKRNWQANTSSGQTTWSHSLGRRASKSHPLQSIQKSDVNSSRHGSADGLHHSGPGSLEIVLAPLIRSALQHQRR